MRIDAWRESRNMSRVKLAELLGLEGQNPSAKLRTWELGQRSTPLLIIPKLIDISGGEITVTDLVETRREYLAQRDAAAQAAE